MPYHLLHMRAVYLLLIYMINNQTPLINQLTLHHKCGLTLVQLCMYQQTSITHLGSYIFF